MLVAEAQMAVCKIAKLFTHIHSYIDSILVYIWVRISVFQQRFHLDYLHSTALVFVTAADPRKS